MTRISRWANAAVFAAGLFTIPQAHGETLAVPLQRDGAAYYAPISINGHRERCLVDTGADIVSVPQAWIDDPRFHVGFQPNAWAHMKTAMGTVTTVPEGVLPALTVGDVVSAANVRAIVSPTGSDCLLGQSFLSRFAAVMLDYVNRRLLLVRQ